MKLRLHCLVFSIFLLLVSCAPNNSSLDSGLFTGKPCKIPCWNGLTPGVSTAKDVDQFMQGLSIKKWPARRTFVYNPVYNPDCKMVQIADRPGTTVNASVNMNVDHGKLVYIQSVHDNMPSLGQIADHLGPPEYFEALHVIGPDGEGYALTIYYPKQGVVFEVSVDLKDLGFIKPNMVVNDIQYFEPG